MNLGRVMAVLGVGGGVGATTVAVNLGVVLSTAQAPCAFLDLRLGSGDAATLLDLAPEHTLADFCRVLRRMDKTLFGQCLTRHASGLAVLAASNERDEHVLVTPQAVRKALQMARGMFPHVIIELDSSLRETDVQILRPADLVLLVTRLDCTCARQAGRMLDLLQELRVDRKRVRLIVNRFGRPQELPLRAVESTLGMKALHLIPDDAANVNWSNNHGAPVSRSCPRSAVSKSLRELAEVVTQGGNQLPSRSMTDWIKERLRHVLAS